MSSIQEILASILQAVYGKDVRQAIHDGVEMAYNKADNAETSAAAAAEAASGSQNSAAASAQAAANSASSASDSADLAEQYKNEAFHTTPAGYEAFVGEVNSSLDFLAETGVKNILECDLKLIKYYNTQGTWNGLTYVNNGITFKINTNGGGIIDSIEVSGTNAAMNTDLVLSSGDLSVYAGDILSGCPSGGGNSSFSLRAELVASPWTVYAYDAGNGGTISNTIGANSKIFIRVQPSVSISGTITFRPMVRKAIISDSSFASFALSNAEITKRIGQIEFGVVTNINAQAVGALIDSAVNEDGSFNGIIRYNGVNYVMGYRYSSNENPPKHYFIALMITFGNNGYIVQGINGTYQMASINKTNLT